MLSRVSEVFSMCERSFQRTQARRQQCLEHLKRRIKVFTILNIIIEMWHLETTGWDQEDRSKEKTVLH